jgi:hypothetical protein
MSDDDDSDDEKAIFPRRGVSPPVISENPAVTPSRSILRLDKTNFKGKEKTPQRITFGEPQVKIIQDQSDSDDSSIVVKRRQISSLRTNAMSQNFLDTTTSADILESSQKILESSQKTQESSEQEIESKKSPEFFENLSSNILTEEDNVPKCTLETLMKKLIEVGERQEKIESLLEVTIANNTKLFEERDSTKLRSGFFRYNTNRG